MPSRKYYFHPPGQISRWGVVDVGLKCTHSCEWCYYAYLPDGNAPIKKFAGMRRADWKDTGQLIAQIDAMADNGFLGFDITGGEPSLFPGIVDIVRHATDRGLSSRMITLGQFLGTKGLLERLLDAGLTDMLFSYHTSDAELFKRLTGGQLSKMHDAMNELGRLGFAFGTNTTCVGQNYQLLPDLARSILEKNVYVSNFVVMNAYYGWADGKASEVRAKYTDIAASLREAVSILEDEGGVAVNIRYAPLCTMAGVEKNVVGIVGVRYDPHEWANTVRHFGPAAGAQEGQWLPMKPGEPSPGSQLLYNMDDGKLVGRGSEGRLAKVFAPQCGSCSALKVCDGIDQTYLQQVGPDEFVPYIGDDRGTVLDKERLAYNPAYAVKRQPDAPIKEAVARLMGQRPLSRRPLVSVIVANYNYGRYLDKALGSILAQTWPHIEIIVVDDASTDDSREVLKAYEDRCTVIYRESNSGNPCFPHNEAVAVSRGELIMYLDPDDWIERSYVEEGVRLLQKHPEAGIVYPGMDIFGDNPRPIPANAYDIHRLILANFIPCCAIYRREMWEESGGYVDNVKGADDWNLWVSGASLGYLGVPLPRQLFHYYAKSDGLFEKESKPNLEARLKQVILNNSDVYPPETVRWAKPADPGVDVNAIIERLAQLDASASPEEILATIQDLSLDEGNRVYVTYRLIIAARYRTAYLMAKCLIAAGVRNPILPLAQSLGGVLYGLPIDEAEGMRDLTEQIARVPEAGRSSLLTQVIEPAFDRLASIGNPELTARLHAMRNVIGQPA